MDLPPKPICFVKLRAEIAFDRMKFTPQRRMDELELLMKLGEDSAATLESSRPNAPPSCRTDSNLRLE